MDEQILHDKLELIQWLSSVEDRQIIEKLLEFRKQETKEWWKEISDDEEKSLKKGIKQADDGMREPHSKARELYERWL